MKEKIVTEFCENIHLSIDLRKLYLNIMKRFGSTGIGINNISVYPFYILAM